MSFLSMPRPSHLAGLLVLTTVMALLAPGSVSSAAESTPIITAPTDGATVVSSPMLVSADSGAAFVRFVVAGQIEQTVAVSGGSAVTEIPVHGLLGGTSVEAYDCESLVLCAVTAANVAVNIDLEAPVITAPAVNDVVGSTVTVRVRAPWGGALHFFVDGSPAGKVVGSTSKLAKQISLVGRADGDHVLSVQQCNADGSICAGGTDQVSVIKDTKGPRWSDLSTSNRTVFPVKDRYQDTTVLSARVGEKSRQTKVEIHRAGGPIVRTLTLGRVDAGKVRATWNGRKSNGDIVPKGKYTFRFVGTDTHGIVGKSADRAVYVSDKRLVKKTVTKTVSAWGSKYDAYTGVCSSIRRVGSGTVGLRSNSRAACTGDASVALTAHKMFVGKAVRYGSLRISAFSGRSQERPGRALMFYVTSDGDTAARSRLDSATAWYTGDRVKLAPFIIKGRIIWFVGTANGLWYDVRQFRVTYTVTLLR